MVGKSIQVREIVKDYPGARVLDGVSFDVEAGTVHGFLGPNGAGKSTTINILTGLITPTSGDVWVNGVSIFRDKQGTCGRMGLLPENLPLYLNMRVDDYLSFCRDIYSFRSQSDRYSTGSVLEKCGLTEVARRLIGNLSKGYRQRVGIAQALVARPEIVILDEPMSGLDPVAVVEMRKLILGLRGEHTVLLSSHRLPEVSMMCSHLTIIKGGKILKSGVWEQMREDLSGGKRLTLRLTHWKREVESALAHVPEVESVQVESDQDGVRVHIGVSGERDLRARLSRLVVEQGCGLLEIGEEVPELEDIFQMVTKKYSVPVGEVRV